MEIIFIVAIISTKDVYWVFVDYCRMRMPWCRRLLKLIATQNFLPRIVINIVFEEIVDSIKAIIPSKDINRPWMHYWNVSVSRWRRHIICLDFFPSVVLDAVGIKVILSLHPIVATKDVDDIFKPYTRMKRSLNVREKLTGQGMSTLEGSFRISYQQ